MAYREDSNLEFLKHISDTDLDTVFEILTKDKDGSARISEELTTHDRVKENTPNHNKYWDLIAAEIQCFGANTFATMLRGGEGVLYEEVLIDVCNKIKVNFNKKASIEIIEHQLMMKILTDSMEKMSPEELKKISEDLNLKTTNFTVQALTVALQGTIKFSGFAAYQVSLIVANAVAKALLGHGLKFATNTALTRSIGVFAGPIGWALTGIWTLADIAGPAYRITIPAVIQIAFLRAKMKYAK